MQENPNAKIVIVGDGAIGKTCVMVRYSLRNAGTPKGTSILTTPPPSSKIEPRKSQSMGGKSISVCGTSHLI